MAKNPKYKPRDNRELHIGANIWFRCNSNELLPRMYPSHVYYISSEKMDLYLEDISNVPKEWMDEVRLREEQA